MVVGAMIGYVAQLILLAVDAGGDMVNMQMGLSSAMVLDPTTSSGINCRKMFSTFGTYYIYSAWRNLLANYGVNPQYSYISARCYDYSVA